MDTASDINYGKCEPVFAGIDDATIFVVSRISALAGREPEFRSALAYVLGGLLDTEHDLENDRATAGTVPRPSAVDGHPPTKPDCDTDAIIVDRAATSPEATATTVQRIPREPIETDLSDIEARCRFKAEGARWAAERQRRIQEGTSFRTAIAPFDRELIGRAKQLGCYPWTNRPNAPRPDDLNLLDVLGSCFETAAEAVALLRECAVELDENVLFRQCLDVAAEAQSALRSAVMAVDGPIDADQQSIFQWLKTTAIEKGVFIERYLRADDPADPYSWADIQNRIQDVRAKYQKVLDHQRQRVKWVSRLRYHAKRIDAGEGTDHDRMRIVQVIDEMVMDGVPPSSREIRDVILPIMEFLPQSEGFPQSFHLVLREAEKYLAAMKTCLPCQNELVPTDEVQAVRKFLEGKSLVLIGGESRDHAQRAIKEAFALEELIWLDSREHQSVERFKPFITRANVTVVALLIRWASHSYGELKRFCDQHGKLFVRLPGGYSPNQFANQIVAQCGTVRNSPQAKAECAPVV